jgi:hypothetical protein
MESRQQKGCFLPVKIFKRWAASWEIFLHITDPAVTACHRFEMGFGHGSQ